MPNARTLKIYFEGDISNPLRVQAEPKEAERLVNEWIALGDDITMYKRSYTFLWWSEHSQKTHYYEQYIDLAKVVSIE